MIRQPLRRGLFSARHFYRRYSSLPPNLGQTAGESRFAGQQVRFVRAPLFSWRRVTKFVAYSIPFYLLYLWSDIRIEISLPDDEAEKIGPKGVDLVRNKKEVTDKEDDEGEDEDDEFEGDEDATFIPFTWPKELPRTYYKGSDPEWQEFLKFSKNQARHKDVQQRVVSQIRSSVTSRILGTIDVGKGRYWLDLSFPPGPPKAFAVSGIEIGNEYVAYIEKEIDKEHVDQLKEAILPIATVQASWAVMKYMAKLQIQNVREYVGLPPMYEKRAIGPPPDGTGSPVTPAASGFTPAGVSPPPGAVKAAAEAVTKAVASAANQASDSAASQQANPHSHLHNADRKKLGLPEQIPVNSSGGSVALMIFLSYLSHNKMHAAHAQLMPIHETPRGCVHVGGLVEVLGTRGRALLDITAAYNPKTDEIMISGWTQRKITLRTQRPRGGP